jgi:hypothetical protein
LFLLSSAGERKRIHSPAKNNITSYNLNTTTHRSQHGIHNPQPNLLADHDILLVYILLHSDRCTELLQQAGADMEEVIISVLADFMHITLLTSGLLIAFESLYDTYTNW